MTPEQMRLYIALWAIAAFMFGAMLSPVLQRLNSRMDNWAKGKDLKAWSEIASRTPEFILGWRSAMQQLRRETYMPAPWPDPPEKKG